MQTKKLIVCNYNISIGTGIMNRFRLIKNTTFLTGLFIFLFLTLSFAFFIDFYETLNSSNNRTIFISNFKLDINKLSETAVIIESERSLNNSSQINSFGSDGEIIDLNEIKPDLKTALINIADVNNDKKISNDEISGLQIMRLNPDVFQKELKDQHFTLSSADCNLKNYSVITHGKYAGTILYTGPFKFVDNENKRYFGLELFD